MTLHHGHRRVLDWLEERPRSWFGRRRRWAYELLYQDPPMVHLVSYQDHHRSTFSITAAGKEARRALEQ